MATKKIPIKSRPRKKLKPKTENQSEYIRCIAESAVTLCSGPAGSGKTAVSVGLACEHLIEGKTQRIIISRPIVESGYGLGYLPGTFEEKAQPYLMPIIEEMHQFLTRDGFEELRNAGEIEVCPLEYMRGRNFHDSFIILDEAQNATFEQIKMLITRVGRRSKVVINGDLEQSDLPFGIQGGLEYFMDVIEDVPGVSVCELEDEDIIRNDIIAKILIKLSEEGREG